MSINLTYTDIPVNKWRLDGRIFRLEYQCKTLNRVLDKLTPLVEGGATITVEHRLLDGERKHGATYDVIDIVVTQ